MWTGTGKYAESNTVAGVTAREAPAREDPARGRALYDSESYLLSPGDRSYSRMRTAEAEETARVEDVMTMLTRVATVTGLKAAFRHSRRGAAVATPLIIAGGLLFGPVGIFIGGTLGGFVGWMVSEDFKSVPQVLMELPAAEKQKLCAEAMAVVKHLDWNDAAQLTKLVLSNSIIKDKILGVLSTYIKNKLKGKLMYKK